MVDPANGVDVLGLAGTDDPCYHDKDKIRLVSARMTLLETQNAISSANAAKYEKEFGGSHTGFFGFTNTMNSVLLYTTGLSWIDYGYQADSRFYGSNYTSDVVANNEFYFMGQNMKSWEVNYYFTNSALRNGGFSESSSSNFTYAWNSTKAVGSGLWNRSYDVYKDRMNEGKDKLRLVDKAYRNDKNDLIWLKKEDDFEETEFGQFWPVINPKTGEIGREFFRKSDLNKKQLERFKEWAKTNCPQNGPTGGTQKPKPKTKYPPGFVGPIEVVFNHDPNLIIGPDGIGKNKWVSINDRLPYQIQFENDTSATAPVKVVKVIYPIDPKQDINTFQLGSFGFNSLTFNTPDGSNSYYQRLDARDSLGLYVDVTAGVDAVKKQAFWIFESIDPTTQLATNDPSKGFLLLQNKIKSAAGNGFVNFTIKPINTAHTGDTLSAVASIVFDANDTVPTNRTKNTIDALPPTTRLNTAVLPVDPRTFRISWHGNDDAGGSGLQSYSVFSSVNGGAYSLYKSNITDTFLLVNATPDTTYCFFVAGKDSVKNEEALSNRCDLSVTFKGAGYVSTPKDFYRSATSGTWNATSTWESSPDNINYYPATLTPDSAANIITIRNGHTVTVTTNVTTDQTIVNPLGAIVVTGSILNVTNNGLTLKSDATGTARIGNSTGTISGNVVVERYTSNRRAWRLLGIPFSSSTQTIKASWMEGGSALPDFGTQITTFSGDVNAANFDAVKSASSIRTYANENFTSDGAHTPNTLNNITSNQAYFLFVRGDRSIDRTTVGAPASATTLRITGVPNQGSLTGIGLGGTSFSLVSNPYPSYVDFDALKAMAANSSINTFYVWDASIGAVGQYRTVQITGSGPNYTYTATPGTQDNTWRFIEPGTAFFVAGNRRVDFTENTKTSGVPPVSMLRTASPNETELTINLYTINANNVINLADGIREVFDNSYAPGIDIEDAKKNSGFELNLGIVNNSDVLAIEKRPLPKPDDIIYLKLWNSIPGNYQFEVQPFNFPPDVTPYLNDSYLNTRIPIDQKSNTNINFTITADVASAAENRFSIVFTKPAIVNAIPSIVFYPNPTNSGYITLQLNNMAKGLYNIKLINALGQSVSTMQIDHGGGSATKIMAVTKGKGAYMLEIIKPDDSKQINKLIIN